MEVGCRTAPHPRPTAFRNSDAPSLPESTPSLPRVHSNARRSVDGKDRKLTVPEGAAAGKEYEFNYVDADGTTKYFKATVPRTVEKKVEVKVVESPTQPGD